jgi:single-stranded DNA-binding protein
VLGRARQGVRRLPQEGLARVRRGRITYRKVEKPDGQTKYYTEIVAREVVFLSSPKDRPQGERGAPVDDGFGAPPAPFPADDDSMPF